MRPEQTKCFCSGFHNPLTCWIFNLGGVRAVSLDIHHNRPSTVLRECQMFRDRIVLLFPSIDGALAQEASCVIRIRLMGFIVETRMRQL